MLFIKQVLYSFLDHIHHSDRYTCSHFLHYQEKSKHSFVTLLYTHPSGNRPFHIIIIQLILLQYAMNFEHVMIIDDYCCLILKKKLINMSRQEIFRENMIQQQRHRRYINTLCFTISLHIQLARPIPSLSLRIDYKRINKGRWIYNIVLADPTIAMLYCQSYGCYNQTWSLVVFFFCFFFVILIVLFYCAGVKLQKLWREEIRPLMVFPWIYIAILIFPYINR